MVRKRAPSGISTTSRRVSPGVWKARCTPQRGQTPPKRGEAEAAAIEAAQHVAGTVEVDEEERHAPGAGPLQGHEPLADMLEGRAEAPAEEADVVAERLGGVEKALVGHQAGAGEIAREVDDEEVARVALPGPSRRAISSSSSRQSSSAA